jgi:hypothetical protein
MFHSSHHPDIAVRAPGAAETKVRRSNPATLLLSGLILLAAAAPLGVSAAYAKIKGGPGSYSPYVPGKSIGVWNVSSGETVQPTAAPAAKTKPVAVVKQEVRPFGVSSAPMDQPRE